MRTQRETEVRELMLVVRADDVVLRDAEAHNAVLEVGECEKVVG